jgi:tetratricopeptide (TPR) repeat protein
MPSPRSRAALFLLLTLCLASVWVWWRQRAAPHSAAPAEVRPAAEQRLAEAVTREPGSAAAHRELGRYYLRARQPFEALWELEQARTLSRGDRGASLDTATALAMAGLYPEAEALLREVLAAPPPARTGRGELAALWLATARPGDAVQVLRAAPGLADWPQGQLLLARAQGGVGDAAAARRAYERYLRLSAGSPDAVFRLGRFLLSHGEAAEARALLEPVVAKAPKEARLLQLLAMTYSAHWGEKEDPDRQGELLSRAVQTGEAAAVPARLALGALYLRHGRFKEGGAQLEPVAEKADLPAAHHGLAVALQGLGQRAEAHYQRGMAAALEGHADRALAEFQSMARLAPADARAQELISQSLAQMDRLNEALKVAEALYQRGTRTPELFERLASLYLLTYNRRAGRRLCEAWRQAQPESGRPLACLGKIALADLRLSEAVKQYEAAVAKEPRNSEHLMGLAEALGHQPSPENSRRAVALLRQSAAAASADAGPRYQLGVRLQQMGQLAAARRELLRSLDLDPTQAAAANNLLQIATALGQPALADRFGSLQRALLERKRALEAAWKRRWEQPGDAGACGSLARLLARRGDLTGAEYQLQRAVELRPGWTEARRLREQVGRLLDGTDEDGWRLVRLDGAAFTAETQSTQRGKGD